MIWLFEALRLTETIKSPGICSVHKDPASLRFFKHATAPGVFAGLPLAAFIAFQAAAQNVVINEIMYHPGAANPGEEYVELYNPGLESVDLGGWRLSSAVTFTFPSGTVVAPGGIIVVAKDAAAARSFYGMTNVVGDFDGRLDNAGETIQLWDDSTPAGLIDVVAYDDVAPWPPEADGGVSLELFFPGDDNANPASWGIGQPYSPGQPNVPRVAGDTPVIIREIMYRPLREEARQKFDRINFGPYRERGDDELGEYLELFNRGTNAVSLAGWAFTDGISFTFQPGFVLNAGAHLVIASSPEAMQARFGITNVAGPFTGVLSDGGERLTLRDASGRVMNTVRYSDSHPWPEAPDELGVSLECLFPNGDNSTPANWRASQASEASFHQQWSELDAIRITNRLTDGWSDVQNPSGPWSFRNGNGTLINGHLSSWLPGDLGSSQPAWTDAGAGGIPGWARSTGSSSMPGAPHPEYDFPIGTIMSHGPSEVWWTAATPGQVSIEGGVWLLRHWGRDQAWHVKWNNTLLTSGMLLSADMSTTSANPRRFHNGTNAAALAVNVNAGDTIRFGTVPPGGIDDFVGYDISIVLTTSASATNLIPPLGGFIGKGTPGRTNSVSTTHVPLLLDDLKHTPSKPRSTNSVTITVRVTGSSPPASVHVETTLNLETNTSYSQMFDDGLHGDGIAGDQVYGAVHPGRPSGTLVHYKIRTVDSHGYTNWLPFADDPSPTQAYFHYDGEINTGLTLFNVFLSARNSAQLDADPRSDEYVDCSLVIDHVAYPHVGVRYRGRGSRTFPAHAWKFRFPKSQPYKGNRTYDTMFSVPLEQQLAFEIFERAGVTSLEHELIRMHLNGAFWGVYIGFESPTGSWLEKHGHDAAGEVYKARSVETTGQQKNSDLFPNGLQSDFDFWGAYNKKVRPLETPDSLREFVNAVNDLPDDQLLPWLDSHVDLDQWFKRWALLICMNIDDFGGHNHYHFLPGEPGGKWQWLGYDFDSGFTFSRVGPLRPLYGDGLQGDNPDWQRNSLCRRVSLNPTLRRIYLLTLRQMLAEVIREEILFPRIDELFALMTPDRQADAAGWGTVRSSTAETKNVLTTQKQLLLSHLASAGLPDPGTKPILSLNGSALQGGTISMTASAGWLIYFTIDGTDPRLSTTRSIYVSPISAEWIKRLKAVAIPQGVPLSSGNWSDLATVPWDANPRLEIAALGLQSGIKLMWPAEFTNHVLETATSFDGGWQPVNETVVLSGPRFELQVPAASSNRFFRLREL
ncbi:MAG TPA: lamin tail domain-containing protein [Verrucomicrobiae bacterium]|nr:lamin tail domain-containing protein [Verrucomicrobiae bacterium]